MSGKQVMTGYQFTDFDVARIEKSEFDNHLEMIFKEPIEALIIHKDDVIALAKEFGLDVYKKDSRL